MKLTTQAYAKVNLSLEVLGRREDGYHLLESLVAKVSLADALSFTPSDEFSFHSEVPDHSQLGKAEDNLVVRAARLLAAHYGIACHGALTLSKHIPIGAGLGGGSADAAACLRLLSRAWRIDAPDEDLAYLAKKLGADVSYCLHSGLALMTSTGEIIHPILSSLDLYILLVNPGVAVATQDVYRLSVSHFEKAEGVTYWQEACQANDSLFAALQEARNSLEEPAIKLCPVILEVIGAIASLPECRLARMSGSGATCFGLFETKEAALSASEILKQHQPNWWNVTAKLLV